MPSSVLPWSHVSYKSGRFLELGRYLWNLDMALNRGGLWSAPVGPQGRAGRYTVEAKVRVLLEGRRGGVRGLRESGA